MHVRFSPRARTDLRKIHIYIAQHNRTAADKMIDRILSMITQLETFPLLGHPGRLENTRELHVPRTKYFMIYTLPDQYHVDIERILHSARKFPPEDS